MHSFISTVCGTNNPNSADVPSKNKQTNKQTMHSFILPFALHVAFVYQFNTFNCVPVNLLHSAITI